MLWLGTRRTRRFHRSRVGHETWLNFIHPRSSRYWRRCTTPGRGDEAQRRAMPLSSPVIVPAKTMRTTRPRESTIACSSAFIDHRRGEYRNSRMKLLHEEVNPAADADVSPPPRVNLQQSERLTLASRAIIRVLNSLSPSFSEPTFFTYVVLSSSPLQGKSRTGWAKKKEILSSSRTRSPQLSSARPNASPYYPRLAVNRRLHWRRAWQAEATLASTLFVPCNPQPRLARAPPCAAIRARPAGASAASGEKRNILHRAESTPPRKRERSERAMPGCVTQCVVEPPHEPTRSKQLCRRGDRAATERDDGRCWSLLLLLMLLMLPLLLLLLAPLPLALAL